VTGASASLSVRYARPPAAPPACRPGCGGRRSDRGSPGSSRSLFQPVGRAQSAADLPFDVVVEIVDEPLRRTQPGRPAAGELEHRDRGARELRIRQSGAGCSVQRSSVCRVCASTAVSSRSSLRDRAGLLDSATWPPGSTLTVEPAGNGRAGEPATREAGACGPSAAASCRVLIRSPVPPAGHTTHSSSTPISCGGPCLKRIDPTWISASVQSRRTAEPGSGSAAAATSESADTTGTLPVCFPGASPIQCSEIRSCGAEPSGRQIQRLIPDERRVIVRP